MGDNAICKQELLNILQHFSTYTVKSIATFSTSITAISIEVTPKESPYYSRR